MHSRLTIIFVRLASESCSRRLEYPPDSLQLGERLIVMHLHLQLARAQTRRQFLTNTGIGAIALAMLLQRDGRGNEPALPSADNPLTPRPPQFAPKAKSIIYLHMSGAPPQHDLFDY